MEIQDEIRNHIIEDMLFGEAPELEADTSFQQSGTIDSTGFLELITFVEERFKIDVADHEVIPENFDSLRKISDFVERKLASKAPVGSDVPSVSDGNQ